MFVEFDGTKVHCLTGGMAFDPALPVIVFLHGAGMDATVWSMQTRWFAHHGFAVVAPDFPAHGRSNGAALVDIEGMADWVARLLQQLSVLRAVLVGHSMGSLVALAVAQRHTGTVDKLILIGTAAQMKVGPDLLAAANAESPEAVAMVNLWGFGSRAGLGGAESPGAWMTGYGQRLIARTRSSSLASDLAACDRFSPLAIAASIKIPTLIMQGTRDMMTPLRSARALAAALGNGRLFEVANAGHMLMMEDGDAVLSGIAAFCGAGPTPGAPTLTRPVAAPP